MRMDNKADCPCTGNIKKLHAWNRLTNREAVCINCGMVLSERDADDAFRSFEAFMAKASESVMAGK